MTIDNQSNLAYPIDCAAKRIGISRSKLYQIVAAGDLAIIKVGRRTLISDRDLRDFLDRHRA